MLSVKQIKDMCKGYTLPNLLPVVDDDNKLTKGSRILFSDDDPAFWSNGFIALFAALPEKYRDPENKAIFLAKEGARRLLTSSIEAATLIAHPIKGGEVLYEDTDYVIIMRTDDGAEMTLDARYVRMALNGMQKKDAITFHAIPDGAHRPLVVKKNNKPHAIVMPQARKENPVFKADVIGEPQATPDTNPDLDVQETLDDAGIAPYESIEEMQAETVQEEPKAEKGIKKPKSKSPKRGSKANTTAPASVIPFSITLTLDGTCDLVLPGWDLTDTHLTSPKLVGIDGLADAFCMVETLQEQSVKVTGIAVHVHGDLSKEGKADVKRLFVRYKPAFIGKNVALVPDENGGITFLGLKSVAYDMLICTHVYMCVSLVSRYLTELCGQDCTSTLPETRESAAESFILDHYPEEDLTYRICPSETVFEIRDLIWGFAKDGEILKI